MRVFGVSLATIGLLLVAFYAGSKFPGTFSKLGL